MGDEGFDPCECIWSHEMAMRRLITLLRQSQSYCTDTECLNEFPGPTSTGNSDNVLLMVVCTILAFTLFFLRPSSLRFNADSKPRNNNNNQDNFPPAPPSIN